MNVCRLIQNLFYRLWLKLGHSFTRAIKASNKSHFRGSIFGTLSSWRVTYVRVSCSISRNKICRQLLFLFFVASVQCDQMSYLGLFTWPFWHWNLTISIKNCQIRLKIWPNKVQNLAKSAHIVWGADQGIITSVTISFYQEYSLHFINTTAYHLGRWEPSSPSNYIIEIF